jgi:hypothetical protein
MSLLRLFRLAAILTALWPTGSLLSGCQTPAPPPSPATNDILAGPSLPTSATATAATLLRRAQSGPDVLLFPARGGGGHHHHAPTTAAAPPAAAPSTTPAADMTDAGPTSLDADENAALHQGHLP